MILASAAQQKAAFHLVTQPGVVCCLQSSKTLKSSLPAFWRTRGGLEVRNVGFPAEI